VVEKSKINSVYLIDKLRKIFALMGYQKKLFLIMVHSFELTKSKNFFNKIELYFIQSPSFFIPVTNDTPENAVKSFKRGTELQKAYKIKK